MASTTRSIGAVRSWRAANAAAQEAEAQNAALAPKKRAPANSFAIAAGWAGLVVVILLIGWSATAFRQQIATAWPSFVIALTAFAMLALRGPSFFRTAIPSGRGSIVLPAITTLPFAEGCVR